MQLGSGFLLSAAILCSFETSPTLAETDLHGDPLPEGALARIGTVRLRHANKVLALAFFPDGKTLASASEDRTVRLWDAVTGKERHRFVGHQGPVESLAIARDGKLLASGGGYGDQRIHVWDAARGKELSRFDDFKVYHVQALAFSPDGRSLASASEDRMIRLWDIATGKARMFAQNVPADTLAFSADGQYLLSDAWGGGYHLWETASGREPDWFSKRTLRRGSFMLADDGKTLLVAVGRAVRWLDIATGKETRRARWPADVVPPPAVAFPIRGQKEALDDIDTGYDFGTFSPDGKLLARFDRGFLVLRDSATGKEVMKYPELMRLERLTFSADGKRLAAGGREGIVRVWDLRQRELPPERGHLGPVHSVAFLPDGKTLATGGQDRIVRLWDAATGQELRRLNGHAGEVVSMALSPDGKVLASAAKDNTVRLWATATGKELRQVSSAEGARHLAFSPDGMLLAVGTGSAVQLRNANSGKESVKPLPHPDSIQSLAFRPDGKVLAVGIRTGPVFLWDVSTGQELRRLEKQTGTAASLAFSPDSKLLVVGHGDQRMRVWDVAEGKELRELAGHKGWVNSLSFAPNGKRLASASSDGTVLLWDTTTFRPVSQLRGHQSEVLCVRFSADGKRLATGSADTTALVWQLKE